MHNEEAAKQIDSLVRMLSSTNPHLRLLAAEAILKRVSKRVAE